VILASTAKFSFGENRNLPATSVSEFIKCYARNHIVDILKLLSQQITCTKLVDVLLCQYTAFTK